MFKQEYIMLHHSGTFDTHTLTWGIIRKNHREIYPGSDHPYHYGVEYVRSGYEILMGRMTDLKGAHCRDQGMNRKAIGICLVGNFDVVPPSSSMLRRASELVTYLMKQFDIPKDKVIGHRDKKDTNCPGKFFDLGKFRSLL